MTARELRTFTRGQAKRGDNERRLAVYTAWHTAALMREKKKLPDLDKLLKRIGRRRPARMSPEQMLRSLEHLLVLQGGVDLRKKD